MNNIILASRSVGRKKLFEDTFEEFQIHSSDFPEEKIKETDPDILCRKLAENKCELVSELFPDDLVFGFDTIVFFEGHQIGKPTDKKEAAEFLRRMSGKSQSVISGYSVIQRNKKFRISGSDSAVLRFKELSEEWIFEYVETHQVEKYAGGYAIQEDDRFLTMENGSRDTVVGAPLQMLVRILKDRGILKENDNRLK